MKHTFDYWRGVAQELSREFAQDVVDHERAGGSPVQQLERIKSSGLSTLLIAEAHGGAGAPWSLALETIREISAGDGSVGALYGYHQLNIIHLRREAPARWAELEREVANGNLWLSGVVNPRDDAIRFTPQGDGFIASGRKGFCTGAAFADRLTISGIRTDTGQPVLALLPSQRDGIRYAEDWDHLGLVRSDSGSFVLDGVMVYRDEIQYSDLNDVTNFASAIRTPVNQSVFTQFYLGAASGALHEARRYIHEEARAWVHSGVEKAAQDPLIINQFGELWIALQAALALADQAGRAVETLLNLGERFTGQQRASTAINVAAAKVLAARTGIDVTTQVFDIMGARATHNRYGFDRFWRDVRTHSLHDPLAHKVHEVGAYALNGRTPEVLPYT
ncbi:desulfurase (plasmid) [Pseudomonas luteola]|uniref:acyl-CoA dehydrogenase family protein n=1 Tax=Pseudomonas luteola TaxID=47886 RepID=UPI003DA06A89